MHLHRTGRSARRLELLLLDPEPEQLELLDPSPQGTRLALAALRELRRRRLQQAQLLGGRVQHLRAHLVRLRQPARPALARRRRHGPRRRRRLGRAGLLLLWLTGVAALLGLLGAEQVEEQLDLVGRMRGRPR